MDKRYFISAIVVGIFIYIAIMGFHNTSCNPINHFAPFMDDAPSKESADNLDTQLNQETLQNQMAPDDGMEDGGTGMEDGGTDLYFNAPKDHATPEEELVDEDDETHPFFESRTAAPSYNPPLIHSGSRAVNDPTHPQYNPAFPRNLKPASLLDWVPSPDSDMHFQPISGILARIYSAFYIDCTPPSVRLFAITHRSGDHLGDVFCHYRDAQRKFLETGPGSLQPMKDHNNLEYTDAYIECPIPFGLQPHYVSITRKPELDESTNQIEINYPGTPRHNFSLCFSPLHSKYNATFKLIQAIEFNRLLGASHFYFYNFSISTQTDQILRQYGSEGLVTVLPWPLPHLETWYYAQILAINDCIYRNRMTSRYVAVVDTDEFIIPSQHSNWMDLINDVIRSPPMREDIQVRHNEGPRKCPVLLGMDQNITQETNTTRSPSFGSFNFKCSYFAEKYLDVHEQQILRDKNFEFTDEQNTFFKFFLSEPMRQLKRNDFLYDHGRRSKLIVRPETVVFHGIHWTVEHIGGYQTAYVNSDIAYLHHYRPDKVKLSNTLDISALKFKDGLYLRLIQAIKKFPSIFPLEILTTGTS